MTVALDATAMGRHLQAARTDAGVSQTAAAAAIGLSRRTYVRVEKGERPLAGDQMVVLADLFGVRAASIIGLTSAGARAICQTHWGSSSSAIEKMRERLFAYLELDGYLTDQGVT